MHPTLGAIAYAAIDAFIIISYSPFAICIKRPKLVVYAKRVHSALFLEPYGEWQWKHLWFVWLTAWCIYVLF